MRVLLLSSLYCVGMSKSLQHSDAHVLNFEFGADPTAASLAKQGSAYEGYQEGYLFDCIGILNALPIEPQVSRVFVEASTLSLASAEGPSAICESLSITNIFGFADPCRQFEFSVISSRSSSCCWEDVLRNLEITAELQVTGGHTLPAVSLKASSSYFNVLPNANYLRITISPAWWSHATSFTIIGLYYSGQLVDTTLLPAIVNVVNVNHAPSEAGRLWMSAKAGDSAGVISAIKDGCSTEESDDKVT